MGDFFRGWKRKVGCVLLLLAIVPAGLWMRTGFRVDFVTLPVGKRAHLMASIDGGFIWASVTFPFALNLESQRPEDVGGVSVAEVVDAWRNEFSGHDLRLWSLYYWQFAVPMTVLSAVLLLWRPPARVTSGK